MNINLGNDNDNEHNVQDDDENNNKEIVFSNNETKNEYNDVENNVQNNVENGNKEIIFSNNETENENEFQQNNENNNKKIVFSNNNNYNSELGVESELNNNNNSSGNIKTIVFNSNNQNSEIENINFNNNVLDFFEDSKNVQVNILEAIKNEDIIYKDDVIYLKELENQLLSEYPVVKQNLKYIQEIVEDSAAKIIYMKNIAIKYDNMVKEDIEYEFIKSVLSSDFSNKHILPVVLDKHKIYIKLKENDIPNNDDNIPLNLAFSDTLEKKEGITEENQRSQFVKLKSLYHELALNKLDFKDFLNQEYNLIRPYEPKFNIFKTNLGLNSNVGHNIKLKNNNEVLRYYDIDTIHWNTYNISDDMLYTRDIIDDVSGKIKGIENSVLINGEDSNIVGFMILDHSYDNLQKHFKLLCNITKIYNDKDSVIIDAPNHNLSEGNIIYIDDTNSFPKINNLYGNSIQIINENSLKLNINLKFIKDGTSGNIYILNNLEYDLYQYGKDKDSIKFTKTKSTYSNESNESHSVNNRNKLFLFDNYFINDEDYKNIVKYIFPSKNDIINNNLDKLNKAYTFNDINKILYKYSVTIDSFDINQIKIIKQILKTNLDKLITSTEIKKNLNTNLINVKRLNKNIFNDESYFLANTYMKDTNIEQIYGKYIHFNNPEDCFLLRFKWIISQKDGGKLYYLYYLLKQNHGSKKELKYISDKIKELEKIYETLSKNVDKQRKTNKTKLYKYQAYVVTKDDEDNNFKNLKDISSDELVVYYMNNILKYINGKFVEFETEEENTLALAGNTLWVWKKGAWEKSVVKPLYDHIKYLCYFDNLDLDKIKLDDLDNIYRKDYGCYPKTYIRLEDNLNRLRNDLDNFKRLDESFKKKEFNKSIEDNIFLLKNKYYAYLENINKLNKSFYNNNNDITENVKINDELDLLIKSIYNIRNYDTRLNYIYTLIEKDCLIIDKHLYSKKFKKKIDICSHYYYFRKINYANSPDEKVKLISELLDLYGDNGESDKNINTCKICGEILENKEYDDTEGFSASGMIIKSREIWEVEDNKNKDEIDLYKFIESSELEETVFKEILLKYGISIDDADESVNIGIFIVKNLYSKTGITLPNIELINVIIDSLQKIKLIKPYYVHKLMQIKKLEEKGFTKAMIEEMNMKNKFKVDYDRYLKLKKSSIISARFLISVQTLLPPPIRSSKTSVCVFNSFDGNDGLTYISCVIEEMKLALLQDKSKTPIIIKDAITFEYDEYRKMIHIQKLFKERKDYDKSLKNKKKYDDVLYVGEKGADYNIEDKDELNENFEEMIMKSKDISVLRSYYNKMIERLNYLAQTIKKIVKDVIGNSPLSESYIGRVESSCCSEDAEKYINFYLYFELESSLPLKKIIDESLFIINYTKYFINSGSIHNFILFDKTKQMHIINAAVVDDEITTSQSVMKAVFELYVEKGNDAGTLRTYVGDINNLVDIKSGLTKKEILSKEYKIDEYRELLKNIEKHNIIYFKELIKFSMEQKYLDELRTLSYNNLDKEINELVKTISVILNKDKSFVQNTVDLLRNIGYFDTNHNSESNNQDNVMNIDMDMSIITGSYNQKIKKIKKRDSDFRKRLNYLKKFYVNVFRKYLSIIKNNYNISDEDIELNFIESDSISLEIQSFIYDENKLLLPFLHNDTYKYFKDIIPQYSNIEINSIIGYDNIYNETYEIIKPSHFNFNDASNILLYIIIHEFNNIIKHSLKKININVMNMSMNDMNFNNSNKIKYISQFILVLIEKMEEDNIIFNDKEAYNIIENTRRHEYIEYTTKSFLKEDTDYVSYLMQKAFGKKLADADNIEDLMSLEQKDYDSDIKLLENEEFIIDKAKKYLTDKLGVAPTDDQLETYKSDYLDMMHNELEMENGADNWDSTAMGKDVLDQGAGYGEFTDYDFETGDGFDYSAEMAE